eukprot:6152197-Pleurochrysis_carterae.AAC.2
MYVSLYPITAARVKCKHTRCVGRRSKCASSSCCLDCAQTPDFYASAWTGPGGIKKRKSSDMASSNISIQQRQQRAINLKWGPQEINGLDQRRAEAIGLEPAVLEVGYGATPTGLPSLFRDAGTCARFVRRTAELLLENSQRWKQIEINTRETNKYYKELLVTSRVREAAYRVAADLLTKIIERPSLLNVWENSCPNLLRSKTRELELQASLLCMRTLLEAMAAAIPSML